MRELFSIDLKNYDENAPHFVRDSARAIIMKNDTIALVYSTKHQYYKFPGGGIHEDESPIEALIRETKEESGLSIIKESISEFGSVHRLQKGKENTIFDQTNYYYSCDVSSEQSQQSLDEYEKEDGYELRIVELERAIEVNRAFKSDDLLEVMMIQRELKVLELIKYYTKEA